ncbi:MAG TPA: dihydrofolate reductase family protein [Polyangiaceae bacterium]|nr:dihydrofolate reductase family protein [Polyangiaceae bacterium]
MSKVRVNCFAISVDGFGAGPDQSEQDPLGKGGKELHEWFYPTRTFKSMFGDPSSGRIGIDDTFAHQGTVNNGAWILGRNMFGPIRGPWLDESWRGWWGDEPPYHVPVFVLTHHARKPLEMAGGTTFHFVTGGIEEALERAKAAAGSRDVRIGGGAETIRQYLRARAIDHMHLAVSPVVLGSGEHLFRDLDLRALGYRVTSSVAGEKATHVIFERAGV